MTPTHRKKAYHARCIQWNDDNTQEVLSMLDDASMYGSAAIMIRHKAGITTIAKGWWIVKGENGNVKCYSDNTFKLKYEVLPEISCDA